MWGRLVRACGRPDAAYAQPPHVRERPRPAEGAGLNQHLRLPAAEPGRTRSGARSRCRGAPDPTNEILVSHVFEIEDPIRFRPGPPAFVPALHEVGPGWIGRWNVVLERETSMYASRAFPIVLLASVACLFGFGACGDGTGVVSDETVEIPTFDCMEAGVNADPFTVADALLLNTPDHEDPNDYSWNASDVVPITLDGETISVEGGGATVSGSTVTITSAGTYAISGTLNDGQIVVTADDTSLVQLIFDGMSIANSADTAIVISDARRAVIWLADGTVNSVTDGATYPEDVDQNAAIFSKSNLSIAGDGSLTVNGQYNDGLTSKDGLVIAGGHITVTAPDDGIRGKDYLVVRGASIAVTAGGDGLKSDEDGDATLGYVLVADGNIDITAGGDGIQAETDALLAGGTLLLRSGGGSSATIDTSLSAKGVKGTIAVVVDTGDITVDAADDGIHSDSLVVINGGTITIATGDDGVHSDAFLVVNNGDITVTQSYEGIENTEGDMTINGGRIRITSSDDGINVAGAGDVGRPGPGLSAGMYHLYVNAGYIVSDAKGDGVDVNGSIVMNGGCLLVHGPTVNFDSAIDYDGSFNMTGGFLAAAGSVGMAQGPGASSAQYSVLLAFGATQAAGTLVHIQSRAGNAVLDFVPSREFQSLAFSSPRLESGMTYDVYLGGTATGSVTDGLYQGGTYTPGSLAGSFTVSATASAAGQ